MTRRTPKLLRARSWYSANEKWKRLLSQFSFVHAGLFFGFALFPNI